ncbi:MAG: DUF2442 domain-containing protein [Bacteroidota bacterium]|nr:DUF2442 domain-containing protein [Bacteroidota bacterium]MDP4234452.1 DUF2442 domain-containing protein [Bacteroidota bacterium]MDP4243966.1 DUF2442 domain-containing protein [Bacteroidota bacterium]MDP4288184.1 DUF2442 domain-containing protein [Bacteroidota bacterium]
MTGHELHYITEAIVIGEHTLQVVFEDGFSREINLSPVLAGRLLGPLNDPAFFKRVRLNTKYGSLEWPNGADFDPELLYHWDRYFPALKEAADQWNHRERNGG